MLHASTVIACPLIEPPRSVAVPAWKWKVIAPGMVGGQVVVQTAVVPDVNCRET